jgi:hypothetical protein
MSAAVEDFTIPERIECGDLARRFGARWASGPGPPKQSVVVAISKRIARMRDRGQQPYYSDLAQTFRWGVRFNYRGQLK